MAIVQASLAEEILTRQERAVIRGIYRAAQLREALVELKKTTAVLNPSSADGAEKASISPVREQSVAGNLEKYLANSIESALVSIKVPAFTPVKHEISSVPAAKL